MTGSSKLDIRGLVDTCLSIDLLALWNFDSPLAPPEHPPLPVCESTGNPDERCEMVCRWFLASTPDLANNPPMPAVKVMSSRTQVTPADCERSARVVTVSSEELRLWYLAWEMTRMSGLRDTRLNGLFGFLQQCIWPRWFHGVRIHRIQAQAGLPQTIEALQRRKQLLKEQLRSELLLDIARLLAPHPRSNGLYRMIEAADLPTLRRQLWSNRPAEAGIPVEQLEMYVAALESGDPQKTEDLKNHLTFLLVRHVMYARFEQGFVEWHSEASDRLSEAYADATKSLNAAAEHFCAQEFLKLCLHDEVQAIEKDLFSRTRHPRSRPYPDLIRDLVSGRRPLSSAQELYS